MPKFYPSKNKEFNHQIVIDYQRVTLNKNEASEPSDKRGGFEISYPNTSSENNFFYTEKGTQYNYMHKNLSIYQTIHYNIDGITTNNDNIVGELVIEHTIASDQTKLYTCYLLETKSSLITDENDIDKILNIKERQEPTIEAELNFVIPKQDSCIVYTDKGNKICVFTTPIQINTASKEKIVDKLGNVTTMFDNYPAEGESYIVVPSNNISKRDAEEIYIDCSPTGASEEEQNTYNIPINSKMATESQESDFMKTTVNYGIFVLAMIVSYITVPLLYKNLVVDGSSIAFRLNSDEVPRLRRIRAADIILGVSMVALTSTLIGNGSSSDNYKLMSMGIFTFVFSVLSYGLIQIKKTDVTFMTTKVEGNDVTSTPTSDIMDKIDPIPFNELWPTINVLITTIFNADSMSAYIAVMLIGMTISTILHFIGAFPFESYGNLSPIVAVVFAVVTIIIGLKKKFEAQV